MAEKMRVHILARELKVPSKVTVTKCRAEGLSVTNHMSTLSAGLAATIREWFSEGQHDTTVETTSRVDLAKVRLSVKKVQTRAVKADAETGGVAVESAATAVAERSEPALGDLPVSDAAPGDGVVVEVTDDVPTITTEPEVRVPADADEPSEPEQVDLPVETEPVGEPPVAEVPPAEPPEPEPIVPAGPQNVPAPAKLTGPRVVRYEAPDPVPPPRRPVRRNASESVPAVPAGPSNVTTETPTQRRGHGRPTQPDRAKKGRGATHGREENETAEKLREWRDRDLVERQERIHDATGRRIHTHRAVTAAGGHHAGRVGPKTEATVQAPVIIRDLCAATGISMLQMLPILKREFGASGFMNMELTAEMAEAIGAEHGVELTVVPARTALDELEEEFAARKPRDVRLRPPVVTMLGHVDHGKTSLLDAIRSTQVTQSEDGGITQHIGAYHLKHKSAGSVTFLDTPGHAAFTAMRARGAEMTDIVILVVAADDGLMPQTIEAINHAKVADVSVVVALNKIDLGEQNVNKIYGQLAENGLSPSGDWGGDTDVIFTSATTGQGIDDLVEHLAAMGDMLEFKADHKGDAMGTVVEAEMKEGVGAVIRVLVQQGTLRTGDVLVCGNAYGKVRALLDDRGQRVKDAGPSIPVEVWGLDEVPLAGDKFYAVKRMQRAKTIGEDTRRRRLHESRTGTRRIRTLEEAFKHRNLQDLPELNIIIKADVDGSVDALRSMLEKIPNDEVLLKIRHAGVGAVTDSDVLLADASDAVIIAFRVLPAAGAKKLADERSVDLRHYKIIYEVAEDIRKALEGLLVPDEKIETRATCEVRDVFRISKVGPIAGCFVASGTIQRNHLVRLIRDGVLIRDGAKIASLRRFKDDAKEVRSGMECGIRLERFDDIKAGDVIEAYEIIKIARTL